MLNPIDLNQQKAEEWMKILIKRSKRAGGKGEIPVAAVILDSFGKCIGHGINNRNKDHDPLGHAEIIAIKQASLIKNDWRLNDCTLIVTLEPCQMCTGAIIQARLGQVIYGAFDEKRGCLGGTIDLSIHKSSHHKMIVKKGVLKKEISKELKEWFKKKRNFIS